MLLEQAAPEFEHACFSTGGVFNAEIDVNAVPLSSLLLRNFLECKLGSILMLRHFGDTPFYKILHNPHTGQSRRGR